MRKFRQLPEDFKDIIAFALFILAACLVGKLFTSCIFPPAMTAFESLLINP